MCQSLVHSMPVKWNVDVEGSAEPMAHANPGLSQSEMDARLFHQAQAAAARQGYPNTSNPYLSTSKANPTSEARPNLRGSTWNNLPWDRWGDYLVDLQRKARNAEYVAGVVASGRGQGRFQSAGMAPRLPRYASRPMYTVGPAYTSYTRSGRGKKRSKAKAFAKHGGKIRKAASRHVLHRFHG